jgi:Flp pilus assembly CpaF family ATPase
MTMIVREHQVRAEIVYDERTEEMILDALGPIVRELLEDADVTEIFLRRKWAAVERLSCGFQRHDAILEKGQARIVAILYLLAPLIGIDLSLASPAVEITLPIGPGIRFTGLYAGPAGRDSLLTLRIPRAKRVPILDVCGGDPSLVEFFQSFLGKRHGGLLIAGGVGCGKTTTLRTISECLIETYGVDEHVVVVEDNEELLLEGPQVTSLCSTRWYPYREVLRGALRQRPTRLIVGEVRGAEAFDAVKAGAAAGAGLYMTIHAPTAAAAVRTLLSRMREGSENGYVDPSIITDAIQYVLVMTRRRDKFSIREFAHLERVDSNGTPFLTGALEKHVA